LSKLSQTREKPLANANFLCHNQLRQLRLTEKVMLNEEKVYNFTTLCADYPLSDEVTALYPDEDARVTFLSADEGIKLVYQVKKIDKKELKRRVKEVVTACKLNHTRVSAKKIREEERKRMLEEAPTDVKEGFALLDSAGNLILTSLHAQVIKYLGFGKTKSYTDLGKLWERYGCSAEKVAVENGWARTFRSDESALAQQSRADGGKVTSFKCEVAQFTLNKAGLAFIRCMPSEYDTLLAEVVEYAE